MKRKSIISLIPAKRILPLLLFVLSFLAGSAQSGSLLLALSKHDHTLALVDPSTLKVLGKVPVGEDPHEVIASSDGKTAYVSIYGGGSLHTINVIDLAAQKRLDDIDTRPLFGPHGLTFVNGKLWFTVEGSKAFGSYDASAGKIDWAMGTGQDRTHMIYVTNDAKKIYTSNVASGTISILENGARPTTWEQTLITVSKGSEGFDVSPDGKELWTASASDGNIFIIDPATKKITATIDAKVNGANRLRFSPDGKLALVSSLSSGNLAVFDARTHKLVKHISIGHGAAGIEVEPDGKRAFVACTPDNYIVVIDLKTLTVVSRIDAGGNPDGLAWVNR
ncbi:MAG TPA: cytochrome D1 domain-containing protein [Puia sp.]|nr:cytochrome D1 domain-containing protein [Puia sp.]